VRRWIEGRIGWFALADPPNQPLLTAQLDALGGCPHRWTGRALAAIHRCGGGSGARSDRFTDCVVTAKAFLHPRS
jgi:hypothetical protein